MERSIMTSTTLNEDRSGSALGRSPTPAMRVSVPPILEKTNAQIQLARGS
jgi:hypothetical protein